MATGTEVALGAVKSVVETGIGIAKAGALGTLLIGSELFPPLGIPAAYLSGKIGYEGVKGLGQLASMVRHLGSISDQQRGYLIGTGLMLSAGLKLREPSLGIESAGEPLSSINPWG